MAWNCFKLAFFVPGEGKRDPLGFAKRKAGKEW